MKSGKKGNGGADDGANRGAEDEQQNLSTVARKYAGRQWRYKRFMAIIHAYIIYFRKAAKEKLEAQRRKKTPSMTKTGQRRCSPYSCGTLTRKVEQRRR